MKEIEDRLEELYAARKSARASGDAAQYEKLDAQIKEGLRLIVESQKTKSPVENYVSGTINSLGQGLSAGFSDEIAAVGSDNYAMGRDIRREGLSQFGDDYPITSIGADIAGSIVGPGKFTGPLKAGGSSWRKAGRLLAEGGVLGLFEGLGRSEADNIAGIGTEGVKTALIGATGGPVLAGTGQVLKAVGGMLYRGYKKAGMDDAEKATQLILDQIEESGMQLKDVEEALARMGPNATLLDINNVLRGLGLSTVTNSSKALKTIMDPIADRQAGAGQRVRDSLKDASGGRDLMMGAPNVPTGQAGLTNSTNVRNSLETSRANAANRMYPLAKSQSVPREAVADIIDNDLVASLRKKIMTIGQDGIPQRVDWDADQISVQSLDDLKIAMDEHGKVSSLASAAEKTQARYWTSLNQKLRERVDELVPEYGAARNTFEQKSRLLHADEAGQGMRGNTGSRQIMDLEGEVSRMSPLEQTVFRNSAANELGDFATRKGAAGGPTGNKAGRLIGDAGSDRDSYLEIVSKNDVTRGRLQDSVDAEDQFNQTFALINPGSGSKTAQYYAARNRTDAAQSMIQDGVESLAISGDPAGLAVRSVIEMMKDNKVTPRQSGIIAEMMMNPATTMQELKAYLNKTNAPNSVVKKVLDTWGSLKNVTGLRTTDVTGGLQAAGLGQLAEQ